MSKFNGDLQSSHVSPDQFSLTYAELLDAQDSLHHMPKEFFIPSKADLKAKTLASPEGG